MLINPINTINHNNFKAKIQPTESLRQGFDMMEKCSNSWLDKDMNSLKDFLDSLARISEKDKASEFKIDIDRKRQGYTYTKINGRRVSGGHQERMPNLCDSYLTVEGIKKYASTLEEMQPSPLDFLKAQVEEAENRLAQLKERYSNQLKSELEQAKKMIFKDAK